MSEANKTLVIDTETTGLHAENDEILQLSIINGNGRKIFNKYLKPKHKTEWLEAQKINHISPQKVANEKTIDAYKEKLLGIFKRADTLIFYNAEFDLSFLVEALGEDFLAGKKVIDIMLDFAHIYGEYSDYWQDYKWQKLTTAFSYYEGWLDTSKSERNKLIEEKLERIPKSEWLVNGIIKGKAHDSLTDCKMTLYVYMCIYRHTQVVKPFEELEEETKEEIKKALSELPLCEAEEYKPIIENGLNKADYKELDSLLTARILKTIKSQINEVKTIEEAKELLHKVARTCHAQAKLNGYNVSYEEIIEELAGINASNSLTYSRTKCTPIQELGKVRNLFCYLIIKD